ncbi:hypothetical protein Patl1_33499 [Pistacia atlantica]|uniref:Uncharacterized protein n=1 Tax=Pistacia atlantica TaxID=434234 RepID=A0ACC0ZVS1_9ROSI|nr:hypothetical protein Patl1_33499 [Pistacia atlantica]
MKWHITEVERLPAKQVIFPSKVLAGGSLIEISGITATQADVEISFEITDFEKAGTKLDQSRVALQTKGSSLDNHSEKTTYGAFPDVASISWEAITNHGVVELQASNPFYRNLYTSQSTSTSQPYRTGYHFQPPKNWMNGPMIYKGIYHLFYQYNPKGAVWGNIVWGHSTSTDLINWTPHDAAIYPTQPSDINGCWSGSATMLPGGKPAILYTGIDPDNKQVQNLAVPKNLSDP